MDFELKARLCRVTREGNKGSGCGVSGIVCMGLWFLSFFPWHVAIYSSFNTFMSDLHVCLLCTQTSTLLRTHCYEVVVHSLW